MVRRLASLFERLAENLLREDLELRGVVLRRQPFRNDAVPVCKRALTAPQMKARLAVGHGANLEPVSNWDLGVLAGAGALRSSANDMLPFLAANLGYSNTPLAAAMAAQVSIRRPAGSAGMEIAYNWLVQTKNGKSIFWHNGGTGGYRTYMGFDPKTRAGVVVLTNLSSPAGPDDIGRHLLDATYPLAKVGAPKEHQEVAVDTKIFDQYVGTYQLAPAAIMTTSVSGRTVSCRRSVPKTCRVPRR